MHQNIWKFWIPTPNPGTAAKRPDRILYAEYTRLEKQLNQLVTDSESRRREADFLRFEIEEIENAQLKADEEETLAARCRKYGNARRIMGNLSAAYRAVDAEAVGNALHQVSEVAEFDPELKSIQDQLYDAEAVLSDAHHAIGEYLGQLDFDEQAYQEAQERLDLIRGWKQNTVEAWSGLKKHWKKRKTVWNSWSISTNTACSWNISTKRQRKNWRR